MTVLVLSAGRDPLLLRTRKEVLESLGCTVVSAASRTDLVNEFFSRDFDMIVLCHSIPPDERRRLLDLVKHYRPTTPVLLVSD
jgi:CheY-like chemotaxis protein